jgi:TPR repeat protein
MRYKNLSLILIVSLFSGCMGGISRMNFSEGIHSFQVQDYRQAFIRLMPEAKAGNPDAQYAVGYMYYYGQGVVEDRTKAWYWITCAAKAGQADAIKAAHILAAAPADNIPK